MHTHPFGRASLLALLVLLCVGSVRPDDLAAQQRDTSSATTLYSRLGGYDFLANFVDTAFPRVASNPQLARLFRGHSKDSQMRQRQLIIDALCHDTGGPCIYIGRNLTTVHEGLAITDQDWRTFMTVVTMTLQEFALSTEVRQDFIHLFENRLRSTVVIR
jgi:hemoglobin